MGRFRRPAAPSNRPRTALLPTALAVAVGFIVLVDLLTDAPLFNVVGAALIEYGVIIAAFALILGVLNVLTVHLRNVQQQGEGWPYSIILLITTLLLAGVGLITGPEGRLIRWTFVNVLLPLQMTFFSLLAFFLLSVAYRAMRVNSVERLLLVASALIVVVGATPMGALLGPWMVAAKEFWLRVPATAGARGLLFGIAVGTVVTGIRLLFDGRRYFK